jgi:hypothetical protein
MNASHHIDKLIFCSFNKVTMAATVSNKRAREEIEEEIIDITDEVLPAAAENCEEVLHPAFHYEGDTANLLRLKGSQVLLSVVVKRPVLGAYREYLARDMETSEQYCLLCPHRAKVPGNKMSNMLKHIQQIHFNQIPLLYKDLPEDFIKEKKRVWEYAKIHKELPHMCRSNTNEPKKKLPCQRTLHQINYGKLSNAAQKRLIAECVCLGLGPIRFADNPGGRHLIEHFNDGKIPRGLGRNAITREISRLYDNTLESNKIAISNVLKTSKFEITLSDQSDDPHIKSRIFSIQHDGWSNEAQESFLGVSISYLDTTSEPFCIKVLSLGAHPHQDLLHTSENNLNKCAKTFWICMALIFII